MASGTANRSNAASVTAMPSARKAATTITSAAAIEAAPMMSHARHPL